MSNSAELFEFVITAKATHIFRRRIKAYSVEEAQQLFESGDSGELESDPKLVAIELIDIGSIRSDD